MINPPSQFLVDVKGGSLRDVTWITPTCANSDHPGCDSDTGPSWVTSVVNAIGESQFWSSTAIFIFWDDYGGFYDQEAPKYLDYDGLGLAYRCSSSRRTRKKARSHTCITSTAASSSSSKIASVCRAWRQAILVRHRRRRTASISLNRLASSFRSNQDTARTTSYANLRIIARPIRTRRNFVH